MKTVSRGLCNFVQHWLPNAYVLALTLTLITFFAAWGITGSSLMDCIQYMSTGMYSLLSFTMQMVLVLVTGHVLANSKPAKKILRTLARLPKTRAQAILCVAMVGAVSSYINWGFGMIAGALVSKEIARTMKGKKLHYPFLIAACYAGNIMRGPSSSIPLEVATDKSIVFQYTNQIIPISDTLFSSWNLIISLAVLIAIPVCYILMMPNTDESIEMSQAAIDAEEAKEAAEAEAEKARVWKDMTFAEKMDNFVPLAWLPALIVTVYLVYYFVTNPTFNFGLNEVVLIFFALGAWAHKTPGSYARAMGEAIKTAGGITLQFMFYAAIMNLVKNSGLVNILSDFFVSIATAKTLPLMTFWSAGIVNIFVPSGGGQWTVQGPVMIKAATELGADISKVTMALCWGDSWTNQIQPFWALPALAVAGLGIKDIMGYCFTFAIIAGIILSLGFLIL